MMGFSILDLDTPVTKGTSGILALTAGESPEIPRTACLSCGRCVGACPMGLNPTTIYKNVDHLLFDEAVKEGLMDCVECGSCAYGCPAGIPLVQIFRTGKFQVRKRGEKN
jgi:electron transport complex protein RnfC